MNASHSWAELSLPANDPQRLLLHNELHARPAASIALPALLVYVAVNNEGVSREQELAHLRRLPGQAALTLQDLADNFARLHLSEGVGEGGVDYTLKWERHTEYTRYSLVLPVPQLHWPALDEQALWQRLPLPLEWFASIPGQTLAAMRLLMLPADIAQPQAVMEPARQWLDARQMLVASRLGYSGHSLVITDFSLDAGGFVRMLVLMQPQAHAQPERAGRIAGRLVELETYRLMALRGLPLAKELGQTLQQAEQDLVAITAHMDGKTRSDQALLDTLVTLAAQVERLTAQHDYRFSATRAYEAIVAQRISELREQQVVGIQTVGEFMQRRLSPALATVAVAAQRLASLSERISRASALLRTRVDIAAEVHNQKLLEKLTRGQQLQLQLQSTVEGLSIAAISYYVVSLLMYVAKAIKLAGAPLQPELAVGAVIPVVVWGVWRTVRRIHAKLQQAL